MIRSIVEFDIKGWLMSPSTLLVLVIWSFIILFSISNGSVDSDNRQKRFDSLQLAQKEKFQQHKILMDSFDQGLKEASVYWDDARNAYYIGNYFGTKHLLKPIHSLAPVSVGQSDLHYSDHLLTSSQEYWFCALRKGEKMDNPINKLYGRFDLGFVFVWLFPLLIIVLNYNILSSEREQGTLKMLLAEGLSVRQLLFIKISFRFFLILCISFLIFLLGSTIYSVPIFEDLTALVIFFSVILLYGLFWILAVAYINLLKKSSDYNVGLLLTIWISLILVLPALINVAISNLHPIPGKVVLIDKVREQFTENDRKNSQILDQFYTDHPEFAIKDSSKVMPVFMYKYMIKEMKTSEELQPLIKDYKSKIEKQAKLTSLFGLLIPSMAAQETLEELSGHSLSQFLAFENFVDLENRKWRNYFHPISLANGYLTISEYENLPDPSFFSLSDGRKLILNLMVLLLFNLAVALLVWIKTREYKLGSPHGQSVT